MIDISELSIVDLLRLNAKTIEELRQRNIVRTSNSPLGDYGEFLYCKAFGWHQYNNSEKDIDAVDENGIRYQIKSRTLKSGKTRVPLSAIRRLPENIFDYAAVILFNTDYSINRSALIPYPVVLNGSRHVTSTNSWKFTVGPDTWDIDGVVDTTDKLQLAQKEL